MSEEVEPDDDQLGPIGALIDALGVRSTLAATTPDGTDLVTGAVVLMRVVDSDGDVRLAIAWSEGLDWVSRRGMLHAVLDDERFPQ